MSVESYATSKKFYEVVSVVKLSKSRTNDVRTTRIFSPKNGEHLRINCK